MFKHAKAEVYNRGVAPDYFLMEMVDWAKTAADVLFERNNVYDIYSKVAPELGPFEANIKHRKAVMLEVLRVLAGFESSWDWMEGVDTSRLGTSTPENKEAGAWQVSYDSRHYSAELRLYLLQRQVTNGVIFQRKMKHEHDLAMEYEVRMLRISAGLRHNGPLYKDDERLAIRKSLRAGKHSIYPWLSRKAVGEFAALL